MDSWLAFGNQCSTTIRRPTVLHPSVRSSAQLITIFPSWMKSQGFRSSEDRLSPNGGNAPKIRQRIPGGEHPLDPEACNTMEAGCVKAVEYRSSSRSATGTA